MSKIYLKKASFTAQTDASNVHQTVQNILSEIEEGGDQKALEYAAKFDKYEGNILLDQKEIKKAATLVPEKVKKDIIFAHDNVKRFAEATILLSLCSRVAIGLRPNTKLSRLSGTRTSKSIVDDFDMKLGTVSARVSLSYDPLRLSPGFGDLKS
jgi:hypothetical protein